MRSVLRALLVALLICGTSSARGYVQKPTLDVIILQWVPGEPPLKTTAPDVFIKDKDMFDEYRIGGTIIDITELSVESPTQLDARMLVFLRRPLTNKKGFVRLPLPIDDTAYWTQEQEGIEAWSCFPCRRPHSYEHFLRLTAEPPSSKHRDIQITYELTGADGEVKKGVAARWPDAVVPQDAIQQARATERAQRRLTDTFTAVARAR